MVKGACMVKRTCVIGSMHGRGMQDRGHAWQGHAWQGAFVVGCAGQGACMVVGVCVTGGVHGRGGCMAGEMATAVDGTHPTGMHS